MKIDLGAKPLIYPQPVLLIANYDESLSPDIMTAVWGSVADVDKIFICVDHNHKTMDNILLNKEFTVSIATTDYAKNADYVGIVSLKNDKDKINKSGFTLTPSKRIKAPIINELPLALECELISFDPKTDYLFARVINVICDESILLENKKLDLSKFKPLAYDASNHKYLSLGEPVADAFKDGKLLF